jgi:hypothetical protein
MRLAFADRTHPFLATVSLIAGGGFLAVELDATGLRRVEAAVELGANIMVDLLIVSASVHVLAGFYFSLTEATPDTPAAVQFDGYLRIGGSVDLLGIASVSVELVMTLGYDSETAPNAIIGSASVTVSVSVLMLSKSFTLSVSKRFPIPGLAGPALGMAATVVAPRVGFTDLYPTEGDFAAYCAAFA